MKSDTGLASLDVAVRILRLRERLEYAEGAPKSSSEVGEDLVGKLHEYFSEAEIVELAAWVALENFRSRFNAGLGLHSEGFSDNCRIPDDTTAMVGVAGGEVWRVGRDEEEG